MRPPIEPTLLVMTATIAPPRDAVALHRTDPELRLRDYLESLEFYLGDRCRLVDRVVFVENSSADLAPLRELADHAVGPKRVEFLSFFGLDYPPHYCRGYGEFKLLDHALARSEFLAELRPDDKWWKVTGRLRVRNLDRLIATAPRAYDLYADFRPSRREVDVRLLSFSRGGYDRLFLGRYHDLTDARIEDAFFERLGPMIGAVGEDAPKIEPEFRVVPRFEGIGGWQNVDYSSARNRAGHLARSALRFVKNLAGDARRGGS